MRVSSQTSDMSSYAPDTGADGTENAASAPWQSAAARPQPLGVQPADAGSIRFGNSPSGAGNATAGQLQVDQSQGSTSGLVSLIKQLIAALSQPTGSCADAAQSATGSRNPSLYSPPPVPPASPQPTPAAPGISSPISTAPAAATDAAAPQPRAQEAKFLDDSKYSSPKDLKKYDALVAGLPADQREQAAKELNRPIAAAKMAADGGPDAAQAKAFIDANPALKTAVDTAQHGGKPDGVVTAGDYRAFAKQMEHAGDAASKDIESYQKENPDTDPQSLAMVRSAAMLRANEPLAKCGALDADGKVDRYVTADALKGLQSGNPGLATGLAQSAKLLSQPGFLNMLDQGGFSGESLSLHNPDKKISTHNIDQWIKKQAPANGGEFASMISDAATRDAVADVDTSHLDEDIFDHPENYSGAQKAAVMIKLQDTAEQVSGGSKLRNVKQTSAELQDKIAQLQADPQVQSYLNTAVPQHEQNIISSDPALTQAVDQRRDDVTSGKALQQDMKTAEEQTDKLNEGKKPADRIPVDYSGALNSLKAELQLQGELHPGDKFPTAAQVVAGHADIKQKVEQSYQESFTQGKAVQTALQHDKKSDAATVLGQVDQQKGAYDDVLDQNVVAEAQSGYAEATMSALTTTKKGLKVVKDLKAAGTLPPQTDPNKSSGRQMYAQLRDNVEKQTSMSDMDATAKAKLAGGSAVSVAGLLSVNDQLKNGNTSGAAKSIYDGTRGCAQGAKLGYDAVAQTMGKQASAGLGRMAGAVAGRLVALAVSQAAGITAAAVVGAAAGPVGWAIDAALAIGFGIKAIIDAVNKEKNQKTFSHNVDPTLKQFGIAKPH